MILGDYHIMLGARDGVDEYLCDVRLKPTYSIKKKLEKTFVYNL